ncbi:MAG: hypothetical protein IPJ66_07630 [Bacteroidetes bacterium]|nr:hypothetical protein [Bacteroidota bacterium]MBL0063659.1 hypothetical protein [Bacteroidota bacterium]MBL0139913.1 hypothetical protein [Bacteroidota bacterium]
MNSINFISFRVLFFLFALGMMQACKKESIKPPSPSFNYFPTEKGKWVEYDVDSIYHAENDNNNDDSVYAYHFQIREELDTTYSDGQGRPTQVLLRYKRNSDGEDWVLVSVWTQNLSLSSAYRTEDNIPYHKLAFPINGSTTWDGNDANTNEEEMYEYEDFHIERSFGSFDFDSTLSVLQRDEDNFVERIYGQEIYATGVGMVFKERDDLGKRNGIVVKGLEYKMTLRDFGPR